MFVENPSQIDNMSSSLLSSYSSLLHMQCEILLPFFLNQTAFLKNQQLIPISIRELLLKNNVTFGSPKTIEECVVELERLSNNSNNINISNIKPLQTYEIQKHSRSLILFVFLIAFVSFISIIGNLCLAKVLYSKRFRLSQTDRIVLCLAISELCLVLIDSPIEIYRFLSFSFSITWLCRFHTFFESFFSSCIIFYHLLGVFDRFVYIYGHTSSNVSVLSTWCRRISTKSGTIILLILPILCSLPIAICNLLHAHILRAPSQIKICVVQYANGLLISLLISFYILPLLLSFFLHAKLIYFIRSKRTQRYLATTPHALLTKNTNTLDSQAISQKNQRRTNPKILTNNQLLLQTKTNKTNARNQRVVMFNTNTAGNAPRTIMTTTTGGQQVPTNNSSNSSASSRSSTSTGYMSLTSPVILYKINSQANANAKRTVLLLVLLLSFYVLCWAPYNIYTWRHAYQVATKDQNPQLSNRTSTYDYNLTITASIDNLHANLRRIIFINYSLYLLSMISMCFSFILYFSLNKQARQEFSHFIGCICPQFVGPRQEEYNRQKVKQDNERGRRLQYHTRYQHHYPSNNQLLLLAHNNNQRVKTTRFNTHPMIAPPVPLHSDRQKRANSVEQKLESALSKRTVLTYGCHIQCCP
ncbi:unnamed protein product [Adineta steineri]|uniref:G-protein coupled receptors family 1 profile domain-containing protein n=1 Tax=Adineta steineri TaxID=433720 RepID=A0A813SHB7_9BILA|nr:unnamed protein product [Adineta steineri]